MSKIRIEKVSSLSFGIFIATLATMVIIAALKIFMGIEFSYSIAIAISSALVISFYCFIISTIKIVLANPESKTIETKSQKKMGTKGTILMILFMIILSNGAAYLMLSLSPGNIIGKIGTIFLGVSILVLIYVMWQNRDK